MGRPSRGGSYYRQRFLCSGFEFEDVQRLVWAGDYRFLGLGGIDLPKEFAALVAIERQDVQLAQPLGDRRLEGCDPPGPNLLRGPALQDCRSKNADVGR